MQVPVGPAIFCCFARCRRDFVRHGGHRPLFPARFRTMQRNSAGLDPLNLSRAHQTPNLRSAAGINTTVMGPNARQVPAPLTGDTAVQAPDAIERPQIRSSSIHKQRVHWHPSGRRWRPHSLLQSAGGDGCRCGSR